ncbi:hypothetical protein PLEOSDRAFT_1089243 [Pleurotus ostreatus PC15]|uniref:Uncharacterized protein n=1 Tax=Pleurotus ostreatus (strain PC15) TaxID=1137138 RepID=A0A067NNW4_PLEO1|nr:hypothetical protein PLEOSDRAFT_1089243 [Pleurotus ostreatus PC15]
MSNKPKGNDLFAASQQGGIAGGGFNENVITNENMEKRLEHLETISTTKPSPSLAMELREIEKKVVSLQNEVRLLKEGFEEKEKRQNLVLATRKGT